MMFTFAASSSGFAKSLASSQSAERIETIAMVSSATEFTQEAVAKCCAKEKQDDETQKPRCLSDNVLASGYIEIPDLATEVTHGVLLVSSSTYLLRERAIRPPIA